MSTSELGQERVAWLVARARGSPPAKACSSRAVRLANRNVLSTIHRPLPALHQYATPNGLRSIGSHVLRHTSRAHLFMRRAAPRGALGLPTSQDSSHLGLPNCSLNRRSFCSGCRPPCAIEIFTGRSEGQKARVGVSRCRRRSGAALRAEWRGEPSNLLSFCPSCEISEDGRTGGPRDLPASPPPSDHWSHLSAARSPSLGSGEAFARTGAERT
jgi:hypothetical protein